MKYFVFLFCFCLLLSCDCEEVTPTLPMVEASPFQVTILDEDNIGFDGNFVIISYAFNKEINPNSVILGESFLTEKLEGTEFIVNSFSIDIFAFVTDCGPNDFPCTGDFTITFKGTGNSTIQSVGGQVLDGDFDDVDGGDFVEVVTF